MEDRGASVGYVEDTVNQCTSEDSVSNYKFFFPSRIGADKAVTGVTMDRECSRSDWGRLDLRSQPRHGG